jgi:hypothetical protein
LKIILGKLKKSFKKGGNMDFTFYPLLVAVVLASIYFVTEYFRDKKTDD